MDSTAKKTTVARMRALVDALLREGQRVLVDNRPTGIIPGESVVKAPAR
jgi:hypothetical protein